MANLLPYRAAMDQLQRSKSTVYKGQTLSNQNPLHFDNLAQRPFSASGSPHFSSNGNPISATTSGSIRYDQNERANSYPIYDNNRALTPQEKIVMTMETRQDYPISSMNRFLCTRHVENKRLEDNHKNINKRLNNRAKAARGAAWRTRSLIKYFMLVRKTESTRAKKSDDNMRYLDTIDGNDCHAAIKLELKAKKRAAMFLHSDRYRFNGGSGLAVFTERELASRERTSSIRLSPFV